MEYQLKSSPVVGIICQPSLITAFAFALTSLSVVQTHSIPPGFENESLQVPVIKQAGFTFGFLVVKSNKRGFVRYLGRV